MKRSQTVEEENIVYNNMVRDDGYIRADINIQHEQEGFNMHTSKTFQPGQQIDDWRSGYHKHMLSNVVDYTPIMQFIPNNKSMLHSVTKLDVFNDKECDKIIDHYYKVLESGYDNANGIRTYETQGSPDDEHYHKLAKKYIEAAEPLRPASETKDKKAMWRNCDTLFINQYSYGLEFLYEKIQPLITDINKRFFKFDITNPPAQEPIQLTYYKPGGVYEWHMDWNAKLFQCRKISYVIQLSNSDEYEGGNLQIKSNETDDKSNAVRKRGSITFFPSFMNHRCTTITNGERWSGVGWVYGPTFK